MATGGGTQASPARSQKGQRRGPAGAGEEADDAAAAPGATGAERRRTPADAGDNGSQQHSRSSELHAEDDEDFDESHADSEEIQSFLGS